ncbi:MAG: hypothetical protein GF365_01420, partial [Candidatus Buchananbacteria bacterium]|nr:hypothetical protein [Candidatus Buchananbacteria bacterium]
KTYFTALLLFIFVEILSFCAFYFQLFNTITFIIIIVLTAILACIKYEFSLFILISELIIGSKGYLFSIPVTDEKSISIRLALFLTIFIIGLVKIITDFIKRKSNFRFWHSKLRNYYLLLAVVLIWAIVWAFIRKNGLTNIFFDTNAYLYFALTPILYQLIKNKKQILEIFKVFLAAITHICLKSVFLLFVFSHHLNYTRPVYKWVRDTGFGEITLLEGNFYRIFSQSQIFALIGFFIVFSLIFFGKKYRLKNNLIGLYSILILSCITLEISLSRSFWLTGVIAFIIMILILLIKFKYKIKRLLQIIGTSVLVFGLSLILLAGIVKFPWPEVKVELNALSSRFQFTDEAAVSSRWSQLPELGRAIAKHPVIGSGFGQTVTYISQDPRVLEDSPSGEYTTFAFEWGYLDQILKFGLAGLIIYLFLLYKIWKLGWSAIKQVEKRFNKALIFGLLMGFLSLLGTHMFSPYLNHPLGIGYLMLIGIFFEIYINHSRLSFQT